MAYICIILAAICPFALMVVWFQWSELKELEQQNEKLRNWLELSLLLEKIAKELKLPRE